MVRQSPADVQEELALEALERFAAKAVEAESREGADRCQDSQDSALLENVLSKAACPHMTRSRPPLSADAEAREEESCARAAHEQGLPQLGHGRHGSEVTEIRGDASANTGNQDRASTRTPLPQTPEKTLPAQRWMPLHQTAGIGVALTEAQDGDDDDDVPFVVLDLIPGMPALLDGSLHIGARILAVDGEGVRGLSLDQIRGKISGPPNTTVRITYESIEGFLREVTLSRAHSSASIAAPVSGHPSVFLHASPSPVTSARPARLRSTGAEPSQESSLRSPQPSLLPQSPNVGPLRHVLTQRQSNASKRSAETDIRLGTPPSGFSPGKPTRNLIMF